MSHVTHGNGVTTDNSYDSLNRLLELTHKTSGGTVIADYVYTRLADGKISRVVESNAGGQVSQTDYEYDDLGRLTQETYDGVAAGTDYTIDYTLDLVGNRLAKQTTFENGDVQLVSSAYDLRDWLTSEETRLNGNLTDTASHGYDANGSLTTRSSTSGDSATYTWDLRNRLASASVTAGGQTNTSSYVYDGSGIEVRRTENGTTRLLLVDSLNPTGYAQVIEELASGLLVASYVYGLEPLSQSQNGQISHYLMDGHSGVRQLLDAAGAVLNAYRYDAFGTLLSQTGNAVNPVLYRGERFDPVLGQYYLRARFYDAARGRFIGIDPFGGNLRNPNTLNKYNYAANDPASFIDPSGWTWEWTAPNGIAAHVLFSAYALTLGKVPTFDFPVSSVSRAVLGRDVFAGDEDAGGQKPDAIDFLFKEFFELKPVTHKSKPKLLAADLDQLAKYARLLGRHGYQAGDQSEFFPLAFFSVDDVLRTPIGTIIGEDGQLRTLMLESAPLSDPTRRGLMYYYTRGKPRRVKPVYAPVPQFALTDVAHCMAERNVRLYDANTRELVEQEYREEDGPRSFLPEAIAGALVLVGAGIAADRYSFQIRYFLSFIVSLLFA